MQGIMTTYKGPSDSAGAHLIATCEDGKARVSYDYGLGIEDNHKAAVLALISKIGGYEGCRMVSGQWLGCRYIHTFMFGLDIPPALPTVKVPSYPGPKK